MQVTKDCLMDDELMHKWVVGQINETMNELWMDRRKVFG